MGSHRNPRGWRHAWKMMEAVGVRVLLVRGGGDPRHAAALCFWAGHEPRVSLLGLGRWDPGAGPSCVFPMSSCHLGSARDQGASPLTEPRTAAPAPWEDTGEARSIPLATTFNPASDEAVMRQRRSLHRAAPSGVAASRAQPSVAGGGEPSGSTGSPAVPIGVPRGVCSTQGLVRSMAE